MHWTVSLCSLKTQESFDPQLCNSHFPFRMRKKKQAFNSGLSSVLVQQPQAICGSITTFLPLPFAHTVPTHCCTAIFPLGISSSWSFSHYYHTSTPPAAHTVSQSTTPPATHTVSNWLLGRRWSFHIKPFQLLLRGKHALHHIHPGRTTGGSWAKCMESLWTSQQNYIKIFCNFLLVQNQLDFVLKPTAGWN